MTPEETKSLCDFFSLLFEIDKRIKEKQNTIKKLINFLVLLAQKRTSFTTSAKAANAKRIQSMKDVQI